MSVLDSGVLSRGSGRHATRGRVRPLRFVTFLAPKLLWFYHYVTEYLAQTLGHPAQLTVGSSYEELNDSLDVAFVCGLPYVELAPRGAPAIEPLAAPVLQGRRYGGKPVYFSDVIVRHDSPWRSFAELRGCTWAYNEPHSQSGYGITRYHLARHGHTKGYFGCVVEAGWHERAIDMVCSGAVDATAIDSHVLAVALRDEPALAGRLRVLDVLGPSSIQPVVAARRLPQGLKADLQGALLAMGHDPRARPHLARALVDRFTAVDDSTYDDIRAMCAVAQAAGLLSLD